MSCCLWAMFKKQGTFQIFICISWIFTRFIASDLKRILEVKTDPKPDPNPDPG